MSEIKIGRISLNESSWLEFTIRDWKGENYASIRKFVDTDRYSGPTKSGLNLHGQVLAELLQAVRRLKEEIPGREEKELCRVAKSDENEIVVCIIPPKDSGSFPAVDIREFVDTPTYTGPTKKGIRFSWERLNEVAELLEQQGKCILDVGSYSPRTSSDTASTPGKSVTQKPAVHRERDQVLQQVIPDGPKKFPHDFVNPSKKFSPPMELPSESIELVQKPDGKFHVSSELGFSLPVKNAVQGNYVVYAHRRGGHSVELPTDMIEIFRSVKAYENYLRELKHSLIQAYLRKSGHRPTAEHRVKEVFKTHGLPWLPDS